MKKKIILIIILILLLLNNLLNIIQKNKIINIYIPYGISISKIIKILKKKKIINNELMFKLYIKIKKINKINYGNYKFKLNMSYYKIIKKLTLINNENNIKIIIPEGSNIEKISNILMNNKKIKFKKNEFINLMKNKKYIKYLYNKYPLLLKFIKNLKNVKYPLEGYLFPSTYFYNKNISIYYFIEQMISKTNKIFKKNIYFINKNKLNIHEILILASLVEKEAILEIDRKKIAQVFYNRLLLNMPLQSDVSILYIINKKNKDKIYYKDLNINSYYNLYINKGFCPGPICNPSKQSINAVLNPKLNNYLYFLADLNGKIYFSKTYNEHLKLVKKYIK